MFLLSVPTFQQRINTYPWAKSVSVRVAGSSTHTRRRDPGGVVPSCVSNNGHADLSTGRRTCLNPSLHSWEKTESVSPAFPRGESSMPLEQKYTYKFGHRAESKNLTSTKLLLPQGNTAQGLLSGSANLSCSGKGEQSECPATRPVRDLAGAARKVQTRGTPWPGVAKRTEKRQVKYYQMALKGHRSADCTQQQIQPRTSEGMKPWELTTRSTGTPNTPNAKHTPSPTLPLIPWQQLERAPAYGECAQKRGSGLSIARARNQKLEL